MKRPSFINAGGELAFFSTHEYLLFFFSSYSDGSFILGHRGAFVIYLAFLLLFFFMEMNGLSKCMVQSSNCICIQM